MKALSSQDLPYAGTPGIILAYENAAVNSINNDTSPDKISSPPNSDCTKGNFSLGFLCSLDLLSYKSFCLLVFASRHWLTPLSLCSS